ncbi:MAG: N-acetyl-gamma-glutamyl-phosphate reductase [Gammaproteobacteria bacterium]|nr:N-acetyl-gamma-glutamyl-phosphate reductase [Gammaproteobacteria bacterium]MBL6999556.1 N-acetyl-gamma-glutamyl-phosphate reductase [Gammaproteobacteria bacterium]
MINVGIVGGTGYTGVELLRLLANHSQVTLKIITSRSNVGTAVSDMFPNLRGRIDLKFSEPSIESYRQCDVVFFATPNATAMHQVEELLAAGIRVIDLAADFRLKDLSVWEKWYGTAHVSPQSVEKAVYGLPEMNREAIKQAQLVANPGCYVTAVTLGLLPLLRHGLINPATIIADCKSGVSGAGRSASLGTAMCEVSESVKAYAVKGHRHYPEIRQNLRQLDARADLVFVPHLMPMIRGIHATLYADVVGDISKVQALYEEYYAAEPFVDVMPAGSHPETRSVKGANDCRIALHYLPDSNKLVVLSVIDNLVKGAAGQAIQNMNLMMSIDEATGLHGLGFIP